MSSDNRLPDLDEMQYYLNKYGSEDWLDLLKRLEEAENQKYNAWSPEIQERNELKYRLEAMRRSREIVARERDALLGLRDECDRLGAELATVTAARDEALSKVRWFVEHAADEKLDGYREPGARAAAAENERDQLRRELTTMAEHLRVERTSNNESIAQEFDKRRAAENALADETKRVEMLEQEIYKAKFDLARATASNEEYRSMLLHLYETLNEDFPGSSSDHPDVVDVPQANDRPEHQAFSLEDGVTNGASRGTDSDSVAMDSTSQVGGDALHEPLPLDGTSGTTTTDVGLNKKTGVSLKSRLSILVNLLSTLYFPIAGGVLIDHTSGTGLHVGIAIVSIFCTLFFALATIGSILFADTKDTEK